MGVRDRDGDVLNQPDDRFEHLDMIIKSKPEGPSWFDILSDYISQDCQGSGGDCIIEEGDYSDCDDHEHTELFPCTCGMESMGGTAGTLQQCYDAAENVGHGLKLIDLARAIVALTDRSYNTMGTHEEQLEAELVIKAITWAHSEIDFEDSFSDSVLEEGN